MGRVCSWQYCSIVHSLDHLLILVTPHASLCTLMYVLPRQWNLSIVDTIGTQLAVLYREVSLIQRQICTQLNVVGTVDSVLIREVSFIQSVLYREVPLHMYLISTHPF